MTKGHTATACFVFMAILVGATSPASAEFSCAPVDVVVSFPEKDPFFAKAVTAWSKTTRARYTEGTTKDACRDVKVPGYEGFPTKHCKYENADAGAGIFPALAAEVIVLNPSAKQLAAWSINACRVNGAKDAAMPNCLEKLRTKVIDGNSAQFPVAGSVIESYCNSSNSYGTCESLVKEKGRGLRPRHTWFRDGVAIWFKDSFDVRWDERDYSHTYDALFDPSKTDKEIESTRDVARLAAAYRNEWRDWRKHIGKPEMVAGATGTVDGHGWRKVTLYVHKAACRGVANELFNAVAFTNKSWTKP